MLLTEDWHLAVHEDKSIRVRFKLVQTILAVVSHMNLAAHATKQATGHSLVDFIVLHEHDFEARKALLLVFRSLDVLDLRRTTVAVQVPSWQWRR